jgi:hypothetical protein
MISGTEVFDVLVDLALGLGGGASQEHLGEQVVTACVIEVLVSGTCIHIHSNSILMMFNLHKNFSYVAKGADDCSVQTLIPLERVVISNNYI